MSGSARNRRYFNPECARNLFNEHTAGHENYGHHLWAILMFEHWLRYIDTVPGMSLSGPG